MSEQEDSDGRITFKEMYRRELAAQTIAAVVFEYEWDSLPEDKRNECRDLSSLLERRGFEFSDDKRQPPEFEPESLVEKEWREHPREMYEAHKQAWAEERAALHGQIAALRGMLAVYGKHV